MVDSVATLYESTETEFITNGLGSLTDAISCIVTEERNGAFELEMIYPVDGLHANDLIGYYDQNGNYVSTLRRIIYCKTCVNGNKQPFRIYSVSKPINGQVTINAEHISYDLSGIPVSPFTATTAEGALGCLKRYSAIEHNFTFWSDRGGNTEMKVTVPKSCRSLLGGEDGSVLDLYGGEYEFDKFEVKLHNNRGSDRGVTISYGKNLTDLNQEENCANVYTGVYPYWYRDGDDAESSGLVEVDGKIVNVEGTFNFRRILTLDLTSEFDDKPSKSDLKARCETYIKDNNIGVPKVNLNVSFVQLSQSEEYQQYSLLENVYLCDTVSVYFPELGVTNNKIKCIKTVFDVLKDRYESIELGEAKSNLADTVAGQGQTINTEVDGIKSYVDLAVMAATNAITLGIGGYVVMHRSVGADTKSGFPDEILICTETPDIRVSQGMWRWNKGGLAFSDKGYEGPFNAVSITSDGKIHASDITAGSVISSEIKNGNGTFEVTPDGVLTASDGTIAGWEIYPTYLKGGSTTLNKNGTITIGQMSLTDRKISTGGSTLELVAGKGGDMWLDCEDLYIADWTSGTQSWDEGVSESYRIDCHDGETRRLTFVNGICTRFD